MRERSGHGRGGERRPGPERPLAGTWRGGGRLARGEKIDSLYRMFGSVFGLDGRRALGTGAW
jgi:hypothetical protein